MSDLGTARGRIEIDASGAERGFRKAERAGQSTFNKLEAASGAMIEVGGVMAGAGVALAAGIGLAIKASADFEKELSNFRAVTGASTADMELLRQKALQIGRDTSIGAGEAAQAMVELGKAGLSATDILQGAADATVALAEAGELDLARAAEIVTATMAQFNLTAADSGKIADILAGTANAAQGSVEDLGMALRNVGPMAGTLGVTLEDTATALGLLAQNGLTGAKGGTALMATLRQLNPQSEQARKALAELGIITEDGSNQFFDAAGNMKSMGEVAQILQDSTANLTNEQKQLALATIFGTEGMAGAVNLAKAGSAGFDEMATSIGKISAADVAKEKLNNLAGAMTILKGTIETALISAGAPFQDALKGIVQGITGLINAFASMNPNIQKFIVYATAAFGALLIFGGGFLIVAGMAIKFIATVGQLVPIIKLIAPAFKAAAGAAKLFSSALLTNPIFLIIAAIALLAFLIYKYWDEIVAFISAAWATIKEVASGAIEGIKNFISGLVSWFKDSWSRITEGAAQAWASFKEAVSNGVNSVLDWLRANWGTILLVILTGPFGLIIAAIINNWEQIKATFSAGISAVGRFFADLPRMIGVVLGTIVRNIIVWSARLISLAVSTGKDFLRAVIDFFKQLPGRVWSFLTTTASNIAKWSAQAIDWAVKTGTRFLNSIVQFFRQLPGRVASFLSAVLRNIASWVTRSVAAARSMGSRVLAAVVQFFRQLPGRVASFISGAISAIYRGVGSAARAARDLGQGVINGIRNTLYGLPGLVRDLLNRAISAIRGVATAAFRAARRVASDLWAGFKQGLGISSPSFIEVAMFAITDTVGDQMDNLKGQIRTLQRVGASIPDAIPRDVTVTTNAAFTGHTLAADRSFGSVIAPPQERAPLTIENIHLRGIFDEKDPVARKRIVRQLLSDIEDEERGNQ